MTQSQLKKIKYIVIKHRETHEVNTNFGWQLKYKSCYKFLGKYESYSKAVEKSNSDCIIILGF